MKKVFLSLLVVAAFTACKKSYDCTCTYNDGSKDVTEVYDVGKKKESDAKDDCAAQVTNLENAGGTNVSCSTSEK